MQGESTASYFIGSYTDNKEASCVYLYDAKQKVAKSTVTTTNPSFVEYREGFLYILSETEKGALIVINEKFEVATSISTKGDSPCHMNFDSTGKHLVVTNYGSGSFIAYNVVGKVPETVHSFVMHEGSSTNPDRQSSPHPHTSVFSEDGKILFIADLGVDILFYYEFKQNTVEYQEKKSLKMVGSGPRTVIQGPPASKTLYLSCELDSTVRVLTYKNDHLEHLIAYKLSPNLDNFVSEIRLFKNKVYIAERGDDKIMIFKVDGDKLEQECSFKVGSYPRHFNIDDDSLIVACQKENAVQKYVMNGEKIYLVSSMEVKTPTCITFVK